MAEIITGRIRPGPLFNAEMRQANRDGTKGMTRRVATLSDPRGTYACFDDDGWPMTADDCGDYKRDRPPHGRPGDIWYQREPLRPSRSGIVLYTDDGETVWLGGAETVTPALRRQSCSNIIKPLPPWPR